MAYAHIRLRQEGEVPEGCGKGEGALAGFERADIVAHRQQRVRHLDGDASQPTLIAEGCGKRFGFAKVEEDLSVLSEREEGRIEVVPQVDGLFSCVAQIREMLEGNQRLLKARHRLSKGRARRRFSARLPEVPYRLLPHLSPKGVLGEPVDVLHQAVGIEPLNDLHNAGVQGASALLEQAVVGHLMREGVLEGIVQLGEETRFVEELRRLQMRQARLQCRIGQLCEAVQ